MANVFDMASHWTIAYQTAPVNPRQFIDLLLFRCVQFWRPSVNNTAQAQNVYYANQLQGPQGVASVIARGNAGSVCVHVCVCTRWVQHVFENSIFWGGAESGLFAASLLFAASSTFLTRAASLDDAASGKKVERAAKGKRVAKALSVPTPNDSFCRRRPKSARHQC